MTIDEALKWLSPDTRGDMFVELEDTNGLEAYEIAVQKINEACTMGYEALMEKRQDADKN